MTFEERFPNLRGKEQLFFFPIDVACYGIPLGLVEENCLDKQFVRENILVLEEEFWHIIGEDDNTKAREIVKALIAGLKL
jgi:hypothetical protein